MLSGVRVLDLTGEAGWLAGKILGDLGADVIKVEPPGGDPGRRRGPFLGLGEDPEHCLRWRALNTSKRSVVLDLESGAGLERFRALAATADVVLESAAPGSYDALGIGPRELRAANPGLVWCALTPFGQQGPYAHYHAGDLVVVAMGGNLANTGDPDRPPVRCTMPTGYLHAAPEAALGCVMALYARERTGRGQLVDVSMHECQLQSLLSFPGQYALHGRESPRSGARTGRTREIWPASDGWISFGLRGGPARIPNLVATVEYMDECGMAPQWLRDYDWKSYNHVTVRDEDIARFEDAFGAFFRAKTMRELYDEALRRRILLAPCNNAREILEHPQLRARDFFAQLSYADPAVDMEQPAFFAKAPGIGVRSRAPRIGEHTDEVFAELAPRSAPVASTGAGRVFEGLRLLELGSGAAGPVAARYFAEQGATVIRIESQKRPDFLRLYALGPDNPHGLDGAPMFVLLNPDKQSVAVNLTKPEGAEIVRRLVAWADVVAENFAPGVMAKFGLDEAALRGIKPDLITVSNCLFGQTGPQRAYPGFGGQGSAIAGFNHLTGWPDREAIGPFATITDSLSPRYVALATAAALLRRRRTGRGAHIDVSQIETGVYSLSEMVARHSATGELMQRQGNRDENAAPHGVYPCAGDDRWIAISVFEDDEWDALRKTLGLAADARFATRTTRLAQQDEIDAEIAQRTREREAEELMADLQAAGVAAGVVQKLSDLVEDPQLRARGHFERIAHVYLGELLFEHSGILLSESPRAFTAPGPNLGEHTRPLLAELLGLSDDEIEKLVAAEVLV